MGLLTNDVPMFEDIKIFYTFVPSISNMPCEIKMHFLMFTNDSPLLVLVSVICERSLKIKLKIDHIIIFKIWVALKHNHNYLVYNVKFLKPHKEISEKNPKNWGPEIFLKLFLRSLWYKYKYRKLSQFFVQQKWNFKHAQLYYFWLFPFEKAMIRILVRDDKRSVSEVFCTYGSCGEQKTKFLQLSPVYFLL